MAEPLRASCLCGAVRWSVVGPLDLMHHCHCGRCRKTHGTPFATFAAASATGFRLEGNEHLVNYIDPAGTGARVFCGRCGSVVPGEVAGERVFVPVGNFAYDPGVRALAHIFTAAKVPWWGIHDDLPCFASWPPDFEGPVLADRPPLDPPGRLRGSCLCGEVAYVLEEAPARAHACHCSRCRRAHSAAHATNLFTTARGVRFTRGEDRVSRFKLPDARFFAQHFCRTCGAPMPRIDPERDVAIVAMGTLDDDPGPLDIRHIYVGSKAPWMEIGDGRPQFAEHYRR